MNLQKKTFVRGLILGILALGGFSLLANMSHGEAPKGAKKELWLLYSSSAHGYFDQCG